MSLRILALGLALAATPLAAGGLPAVALAASQSRTTGTYDGKKVDRLTVETMVLKRTKIGWRIAHIHWSSRAAPAAS